MTLSPNYPANYLGQLGNAYRLAGRSDEALKAFQAYHARSPGFGLVDIVMIHAQAGRMDEAKSTAAELLAARPDFTVAVVARRRSSATISTSWRSTLDSLRAAGVPEG